MAPRITCACGDCAKCKHREYMRQWYRERDNAQRQRESQLRSRWRRLDKVRAYDRERGYRVYDPEKERARRKAYKAVLRGILERQPCEACGDTRVEAHHEDYSKPLDVRWLCRRHHMEQHRRVA